MSSYLTSAFVATSLRSGDENVNDWFKEILRSLNIEPFFGDKPETSTIPEKVKRMIKEHPNFIAILTKRDMVGIDKWRPPEWINNEIGIAFAYEKRIAIFIEEGVNTDGIAPSISGYVRFNRDKLMETVPKIISYLISLYNNQLKDVAFNSFISLQSQYAAFSTLYEYIKMIKSRKLIQKEIEEDKIKIHSIYKKGGVTVFLKGGYNTSLVYKSLIEIYRLIKIGDNANYEEKVGIIQVVDIQRQITACKFFDKLESDFWTFIDEAQDDVYLTMPEHILKGKMIPGFEALNIDAIDSILTQIDIIIRGCQQDLTKLRGDRIYAY